MLHGVRIGLALLLVGCASSLDESAVPAQPVASAVPRARRSGTARPPSAPTIAPAPKASQVDCRPGARNLTCAADQDCELLTRACRALATTMLALGPFAPSIPHDVTARCVRDACEITR